MSTNKHYREIKCQGIRIDKSTQALMIHIQCEPEGDPLLCLPGLLFAFICLHTFYLVYANPFSIWLLVFMIELGLAFFYEARRQSLYSSYEIWTFKNKQFIISQSKIPKAPLSRLFLKPLPLKSLPVRAIGLSDLRKAIVTRMCNDGGFYYIFGLLTQNEIIQMYPSSQDAFLLEQEINNWLEAQ